MASAANVAPTDVTFASKLARILDEELLKTERLRITLLTGLLLICLAIVCIPTFIPATTSPAFRPAFRSMFPLICSAILVGIAFLLALRWAYGSMLAAGRPRPLWLGLLNVLLEMSFVSWMLIVSMRAIAPEYALAGNAIIGYFLFVILATLQLDWRIALFAGTCAGAQYAVLAAYYIPKAPVRPGAELLVDMGHHYARAGLFVIAGAAGAFVAHQLRAQMSRAIRSLEEKNRAVSIFGQHVTPEVAEKLLAQPIELGGERCEVCVMFVDIRGFTTFAEERDPAEVMDFLNRLFGRLIDLVNSNHGIVNKFLGDGFMAVFGAPVPDGQNSSNAVRATRQILVALDEMIAAGELPPTRLGIGLHAGDAMTGNVGSPRRKEYTIIGNVVNLASRIEQLTKQYDARALISQQVYQTARLDEADAVSIGEVEIRGQSRPLTLYKIA